MATLLNLVKSTSGGCPAGHYCPEGTADPIGCPAGTYNDITHQYVCRPCRPGYYCLANFTTDQDTPCPKGRSGVSG